MEFVNEILADAQICNARLQAAVAHRMTTVARRPRDSCVQHTQHAMCTRERAPVIDAPARAAYCHLVIYVSSASVPLLVYGDDWPDETRLDDDAVFKSELILMQCIALHKVCVFAQQVGAVAGVHFPSIA